MEEAAHADQGTGHLFVSNTNINVDVSEEIVSHKFYFS